jgi:type II secretory pathway predicted ATPase ExeA
MHVQQAERDESMTEQADWLQARTGAIATAFPTVAQRHRRAVRGLRQAIDQGQPLAVLSGEGRFETDHVLRRFLTSLPADVSAVFVNHEYAHPRQGLSAIAHALGFAPTDLSVEDLRGVLRLFLENQKSHKRRTVIAIEHIMGHGDWLLEFVSDLVECEVKHEYGLTIVVAGTPQALAERFQSSTSPSLQRRVRRCLVELKRFTATETAIFLRDRLRGAGIGSVDEIFEFDAIARLHEISGGIPDEVAELCRRCLVRAKLDGAGRISDADVEEASKATELALETAVTAESPAPANDSFEATISEEMQPASLVRHQLVVRLGENWLHDRILESGSVVLGRADTSDVHLPSRFVSRSHALITKTEEGHELRDLGSRNGTYIGDERVTRHVLAPDDVIRIGHFLIEYQAVAQVQAEPAALQSSG